MFQVRVASSCVRIRSKLERQLVEQTLDALKAFDAFDGEVKRLRFELIVSGVEEGDNRRRRAKMPPCALEDVVLPLDLLGRWTRGIGALAKHHPLSTIIRTLRRRFGRRIYGAGRHVILPGAAGRAPRASRA